MSIGGGGGGERERQTTYFNALSISRFRDCHTMENVCSILVFGISTYCKEKTKQENTIFPCCNEREIDRRRERERGRERERERERDEREGEGYTAKPTD